MYTGTDFWKNYATEFYDPQLIADWEQQVERTSIPSIKGDLQLEVYDTGDPTRPTLVFAHGIAGYARLLLPFLMPLFKRGYNIVAPDLEGYGYNGRTRGDFTWDTHLQNLCDAVIYARQRFEGPIYLGGASMGGPLAYATDARYHCADGLVCWCLFDFADREFMTKETNTGRLTYVLMPFLRLSSVLLGKIRVPTEWFVSYDTLTADPTFNDMVRQDPQSGTRISLRGAISLVTQSKPDLPHAEYTKPVLVCQPSADQMTPHRYTQRVYDALASPQKRLVDFEGGHFPTTVPPCERWADVVDDFLKGLQTKD